MRTTRRAATRTVRDMTAARLVGNQHRNNVIEDYSEVEDLETATRITSAMRQLKHDRTSRLLSSKLPPPETPPPLMDGIHKRPTNQSEVVLVAGGKRKAKILKDIETKRKLLDSIGVSTLLVCLRDWKPNHDDVKRDHQNDHTIADSKEHLWDCQAEWDSLNDFKKMRILMKSPQGRLMTLSLQRSMDEYLGAKSKTTYPPDSTTNQPTTESLMQKYDYKALQPRQPSPSAIAGSFYENHPLAPYSSLKTLLFSSTPSSSSSEKEGKRYEASVPSGQLSRGYLQSKQDAARGIQQHDRWETELLRLFSGKELSSFIKLKHDLLYDAGAEVEGEEEEVPCSRRPSVVTVSRETIQLWEKLKIDSPRHIYVRNKLFETHFTNRDEELSAPLRLDEVEKLVRDYSKEYDQQLENIKNSVILKHREAQKKIDGNKPTTAETKDSAEKEQDASIQRKVEEATAQYQTALMMDEMESVEHRLKEFNDSVPMLQEVLRDGMCGQILREVNKMKKRRYFKKRAGRGEE